MFLHNDKDFRKLRATNALNWDFLHQELHISLFMLGPFPGGGGSVSLQHDGQWGGSDVLQALLSTSNFYMVWKDKLAQLHKNSP